MSVVIDEFWVLFHQCVCVYWWVWILRLYSQYMRSLFVLFPCFFFFSTEEVASGSPFSSIYVRLFVCLVFCLNDVSGHLKSINDEHICRQICHVDNWKQNNALHWHSNDRGLDVPFIHFTTNSECRFYSYGRLSSSTSNSINSVRGMSCCNGISHNCNLTQFAFQLIMDDDKWNRRKCVLERSWNAVFLAVIHSKQLNLMRTIPIDALIFQIW